MLYEKALKSIENFKKLKKNWGRMVCCFGSVSSYPPPPATNFNLDLNKSLGCSKTAESHAATHTHSHYLDYALSPSLSPCLFSASSLHADCPSLS